MNPQPPNPSAGAQQQPQQQAQPSQLQSTRYTTTNGRGRGRGRFNPNNNGQSQIFNSKPHNGQNFNGRRNFNTGYNNANPQAVPQLTNGNHRGNMINQNLGAPLNYEESGGLLPSPIMDNMLAGRSNWQASMAVASTAGVTSTNEPLTVETGAGETGYYGQVQAMPYPQLPACSYYALVNSAPSNYPGYFTSNSCFQSYPPGYGYIPQAPMFQQGIGPSYPYAANIPYGPIYCANCRNPQIQRIESGTMTEQLNQIE